MYKLSINAIQYTIKNLFAFAGIELKLNNHIILDRDGSIVNVKLSDEKKVVFKLMPQSKIEKLLEGKLQFQMQPSFDYQIDIPFFYINENKTFALISDDELIIQAEIITISFIMLSRFEEILTCERDHYNRFQYINSLAYKYNLIDIPIVDEYAMLLRKFILFFLPDIEIHKRNGKVIPTHDIDEIYRFGNIFRNIHTIIGGDILARKNLSIAVKSIQQCINKWKNSRNDPLISAIKQLIEISKTTSLNSQFYFKGLRNGQEDCTYDILIPDVKYCLEAIKDAGMVVGIHGSFNSYIDEGLFQVEKKNIELAYGDIINSGRQHYLRFDIRKTIQVWENCKIKIDSTLGYAEREGFRCGTCHGYYLYDFKNDCSSSVKEYPLIVMERTLFEYRKLNIEQALAKIERLNKRCQAVEGNFVILWHNSYLHRDYEKIFGDVYCKFILGT